MRRKNIVPEVLLPWGIYPSYSIWNGLPASKLFRVKHFLRKGANIETSEPETKIQHGFAILIRHKTHSIPEL
jgi:hypothetical protein